MYHIRRNILKIRFGILNLLILTTVLCMVGCAAGMVANSKKLHTPLISKEYNDVIFRFMDRPTWVYADIMRDGSEVLTISIDTYGTAYRKVHLYMRHKEQYVQAIYKFLEWEAQAIANKDVFDKEIVRIRNPNSSHIFINFNSGNEYFHYMSIGYLDNGLLGETKSDIVNLDRKNALILLDIFNNYNTYKTVDISSKYQ